MDESEPMDESFFRDPQWVAMNGGFIHENNVLFYFAQSPFFDPQSSNSTVFQQAFSDPRFFGSLANRRIFEAQLKKMSGVEFLVVHDDLATKVRNETGEMSKVWAIQKQTREKRQGQADEVTAVAMYYIVGEDVFQAPTVAKMIGNRLLSTANSLSQVFGVAATLPVFSVAQGHTYTKPKPKPLTLSRGGTPSPTLKPAAGSTVDFLNTISLTHRHGSHFMDEAPLAGEPGAFRVTKNRDLVAPVQTRQTQSQVPSSSAPSPAASVVGKEPLKVSTDVPDAKRAKIQTPVGKLKRRKSRPGDSDA